MSPEERGVAVQQKISSVSRSNSGSSSRQDGRQDSWEILEGPQGGFSDVLEPQRQEGYMLKKRKWPMKGWHKRYFLLDKGVLKYGKRSADVDKGKLHGRIDVGLSVMAVKKKAKCVDLDAQENIYHLKMDSPEQFEEWVSMLRHHRLYRQNQIAAFPVEKPDAASAWKGRRPGELPPPAGPPARGGRAEAAAWLRTSEDMDKCSKDLSVCDAYLLELGHLLQSMEVLHRTYSAPSIQALQASAFDSPKKDKRLPRKWRSKNYNKDVKATLQVPVCVSSGSFRLHASNPNLSTAALAGDKAEPESAECSFHVAKLQGDFCRIATSLHGTMKSALSTLTSEKERLKQCLDWEAGPASTTQVVGLKKALETEAEPAEEPRPLVHQASNESRASVAESLSEFFDAQEVLLSNSSSENEASDDDSELSDVSDNISVENFGTDIESERPDPGPAEEPGAAWRRRSRLPSPSPGSSTVSLWDILKNNIGKDLSKVAMPVQLNEPLNTLQRLCEELEYSELLDRAAHTHDPFWRMVHVATFAVSGYASSFHRTGGKPFNPVLGETFECQRPDRGFRFVAEQVSHHPPVSACHAESKNFVFWQDVRCKNKFWGKSMEIVPVGTTHVDLPGVGDHYQWNKVTSCIHDILSGRRWIEHYGEISIRNSGGDVCHCKITFLKAKYWNSSVNEVEGSVTDGSGKVVHRIFGKWHEAIFCGDTCIWRANPMPLDHEQYYGFTKFAMELNELDPSLRALLPPTDSRLRIDQRLLEEGRAEAAEEQKQRIEALQRERRRVLEEKCLSHQPKFFRRQKDDSWVSSGVYWSWRRDPGFSHMDFPALW